MNKQRKLTRKEKIRLAKQETRKQPPSSYLNVSHLQNVKHLTQLSANKWLKWFLVGVIVLVTFIAFSPALKNDFTNWDDDHYVTENTALAKPIMEGIKYFFSNYYFGNYSPITMITYTLEYHSIGLNPELYHLMNILIHLLNVMLVFWFIYLLSGKKIEVAAIVSLLFGIHPMHVESVAWIAELKDGLYTFFFIGGLIAYYKYIGSWKLEAGSWNFQLLTSNFQFLYYSLTFILFIISLLSKAAAVTFPIVLLLIDYYTKRYKTQDTRYKIWIEKLPFFIVSFVLGIITIKAEQQANAIHLIYTIPQRLLFASYSMLAYIVKLILPINLSAFYSYPQLVNGHLPYIFYITPLIVLLLFYGVYLIFKYSNINVSHLQNVKHLILFGFLFFFVNIAIALKVLSFAEAIMADRYTYLPYIGLFFIIAMGFTGSWKLEARSWKKVSGVIVIIIFAVTCSYLTYARCKIWKNSETLWTDVLNKFPDNPIALNNKGMVLYDKGQYKEAMKLYIEAIQLKPDYGLAYINLANCYHILHDYDNALKNIDIGLKYATDPYKALNAKGAILFDMGRYKEAMQLYNEAIKLKPDYSEPYFNLAECYDIMHNYDNALKNIDMGLNYAPNDYKAFNAKGAILFEKGQSKEAIKVYNDAIQLKPDCIDAYINLANCYKVLKDDGNALKIIDIGLKYNPHDYKAFNAKGAILFEKGKYKEAIEVYDEAIKTNVQYSDGYINIGSCYGMLKDYDNAIAYWKKALEFNPNNANTYKMLGWAYQNKGDKVSADAYYAKATN